MTEELTQLPEGEYAIVEQLGHRTFIGRIEEVERFGAKLMQIEPVYRGRLLEPVMIGGGTLFAFTPCSREVAAGRAPTKAYQLPPGVAARLPVEALPAPAADEEDGNDDPNFAYSFLDDD